MHIKIVGLAVLELIAAAAGFLEGYKAYGLFEASLLSTIGLGFTIAVLLLRFNSGFFDFMERPITLLGSKRTMEPPATTGKYQCNSCKGRFEHKDVCLSSNEQTDYLYCKNDCFPK